MDFATIGGLILGVVCIVVSILFSDALGAIKIPGSLGAFYDTGSILLVFGGGIASALMSYSLGEVGRIIKLTIKVFTTKKDSFLDNLRMIIQMAQKARREGILSLEEDQENIKDPFVKKALEYVVDGYDPELTKDILEMEIDSMLERHERNKGLFDFLAKSFPSWGMIGTLVGLVLLLGQLDDPTKIGPAMAVALITTFYGSVLANFVCTPISNKLAKNSEAEANNMRMLLEGILSIQTGEQPAVIENKLMTFLTPAQKLQYKQPVKTEEQQPEQAAEST